MVYKIIVQPGGQSFDCASGQTVLDAALAQGIVISYGCRSGLCGSCKGRVRRGQVEYTAGLPEAVTGLESERGLALFCKACPVSDLSIEVKVHEKQQSIDIKTLPVKVEEIERLTDDIIRLVIRLPVSESFDYIAGQWIYFLLNNGAKRAFSIANAPDDGHLLELQVRHVRGGQFTDIVFRQLKPGALLRINGPHGTFTYDESEKPVLLVAGGIGFAPIKSILESLCGDVNNLSVHVFCGSRSKSDLYQRELVSELLSDPRVQFDEVLSASEPAEAWHGARGYVHQVVLEKYADLSGFVVYLAGPPKMIHNAIGDFINAGLNPEDLHYESFEYAEPET